MKDVLDFYGKPIVNGSEVAFNYSGEVRMGHVFSVELVKRYGETHNKWTKEPYVKITIIPLGSKNWAATKPSVITNRHNLVVLS